MSYYETWGRPKKWFSFKRLDPVWLVAGGVGLLFVLIMCLVVHEANKCDASHCPAGLHPRYVSEMGCVCLVTPLP
jgi:hypothetical protein